MVREEDPYKQLQAELPDELTIQQIAETMGCSYPAAQQRLRARKMRGHTSRANRSFTVYNRDDLMEFFKFYQARG